MKSEDPSVSVMQSSYVVESRVCTVIMRMLAWGVHVGVVTLPLLIIKRLHNSGAGVCQCGSVFTSCFKLQADRSVHQKIAAVRLHHIRVSLKICTFLAGSASCVWLSQYEYFWLTEGSFQESTWPPRPRYRNPGVSCNEYGPGDCCKMVDGMTGGQTGGSNHSYCVLASSDPSFSTATACMTYARATCERLAVANCPPLTKRSSAVHEVYHSNFIALALFFIGGVCLEMRPNRLTPFKADCLYVCTMLQLSMQAFLEEEIIVQLQLVNTVRILLAMAFLNLRLTAFVNLLYSTVALIAIAQGRFSEQLSTSTFLCREIFSLCAILAVSSILHFKTMAEQSAQIKLLELITTEEVAHSLLLAMGDAVLHLGPDLCVSKPSKTFSALLFRSYKLLEGKNFLDYVAPEDTETFKEFVSVDPVARKKSEHDVVAPATSINLHLLDSNGSRILVLMFHRSFLDSTGQIKHLISVRETCTTEEDDDSLPCRSATHTTAFEAHASEDYLPCRSATHTTVFEAHVSQARSPCPDLVELSESDFSVKSSSAEECSDRDDALIAKAELDKCSLKILSCSIAFTSVCGPCPQGANLMDWVSDAQREAFQRWVEHTGNVVYWTSRSMIESAPETCFPALKLKPLSIEYTVNCEVVGASFEHCRGGGEAFILKLCFTNLKKPRGQRASKKSTKHLQYEQRKPHASKQSSCSECADTQDESDVPLEAVFDIQAAPMKILSCSPAFMLDFSDLTVDDIVAKAYIEGFTAWLRSQVRCKLALRGHSSSSEDGHVLKLKLPQQKMVYCQVDESFTHGEHVKDSIQMPVRVYFHLTSRKTHVLMTSSPSLSYSSSSLPALNVHGHLCL